MNTITIWQERWSTGEVLVADFKIQEHNEIVIENGDNKGKYYLAGMFARTFPTEEMKTKKGRQITMRVIPLNDLKKEII